MVKHFRWLTALKSMRRSYVPGRVKASA